MTPELILAVDVGSTWCKAAYLDRQGQTVAAGRVYTRDIAQDRGTTLGRFWQAFVDAAQAATIELPTRIRPAAIGISSRALFGVCMDATGECSLPAWDAQLDRRTSPDMQFAYSREVWGKQDPFAYGYGVSVGALLRWLKHTRPTAWDEIRRVGALHDYILYRLTGAWVTNPTTGPGVHGWPPEIQAMSGLPATAFPRVLQFYEVAGELTLAAAQALGLPAGIPVVVGAHDGAAANLGVGAVRPGSACLTLGSNLVLRVVTGRRLETGCFSYLIAPGIWSWVGNVPGASQQLDLVAQTLRPELPNAAACHLLLGTQAAAVGPGADGLVLQLHPPVAEGEIRQAVHTARTAGYDDGAIYRAILEAVAFGVCNLVKRAERDGASAEHFVATGGHTQNALFLHILAALLDRPIAIGPTEGGVIGAGMAAAVGAGWYASLGQAVTQMSSPAVLIEPDHIHGLGLPG